MAEPIPNPPRGLVNTANLTLLGELRRRPRQAIDWGPMFAGVVNMLDAFEVTPCGPVFHRH